MKNMMQKLTMGIIGMSMFLRLGSLLPAADKPKNKDADVIKITAAENGKTIKATTGKRWKLV
jgi:hypothetical protein